MKDCCCDFGTMEQVHEDLSPFVKDLLNTTYFHYYKVSLFCRLSFSITGTEAPLSFFLSFFNSFLQVNLHAKCPFWNDEAHCFLEDCSVKECPEVSYYPLFFPRATRYARTHLPNQCSLCHLRMKFPSHGSTSCMTSHCTRSLFHLW
jgi:hypothetical protein